MSRIRRANNHAAAEPDASLDLGAVKLDLRQIMSASGLGQFWDGFLLEFTAVDLTLHVPVWRLGMSPAFLDAFVHLFRDPLSVSGLLCWHMTVPDTFRRRAKVPKVLVLHRAVLSEKDVEHRHGFVVTRPLRSIVDQAVAESVSRDIVEQALREGRERGLITVREMSDLRHNVQIPKWFEEMLAASKA